MSFSESARAWWSSLSQPPRPVTRGEAIVLWVAAVMAAVSRLLALSKTIWDWDEALFLSAMRKYDVTVHHPHPPGFPLYIGAAKLLAACGLSDFHALQAIVLLSAMAIVPVVYLLGREARFPSEVSISAAAIYAFLPNVWVYSGTLFSDIPSIVFAVLAIALFLRGCRSDASLLLAGIVLGISIAFRPQNLLIGSVAAAIAIAWRLAHRQIWQPASSTALAIVVVAASYGTAALLSHGLGPYLTVVRVHSAYIARIDSLHNPLRMPLGPLLGQIVLHPFQARDINFAIALLAALGLIATFVHRRISTLVLIATFAPFLVTTWLYLDPWGMSRFAVAWLPLYAFLAADGLMLFWPAVRRSAVVVLVAAMIVWSWPILRDLHNHPSPPAAAAAWVAGHRDPATTTIWTHSSVLPQTQVLLPRFRVVSTEDSGPPTTFRPGDVYVREGVLDNAIVFSRRRKRTEGVVRQRYFDVSVIPIERYITYGDGWYQQETDGKTTWRWTSNHGRILLPPLGRPGVLTLHLHVPLDAFRSAPAIEIRIDGAPADRFVPSTADVQRQYTIGPAHGITTVDILTTEVMKAPGDPRLLGIRLNGLEWRANVRP